MPLFPYPPFDSTTGAYVLTGPIIIVEGRFRDGTGYVPPSPPSTVTDALLLEDDTGGTDLLVLEDSVAGDEYLLLEDA